MSHLTPEQLLDVLEGTVSRAAFPHLQSCVVCDAQLRQLQEAMRAALDSPAPEPSPLFWDHFSARVREAVTAEQAADAAGRRWWSGVSAWRVTLAAAAIAALVLVLSATIRRGDGIADGSVPTAQLRTGPPPGSTQPGPVDLVPLEQDPALALLGDLGAGLEWEAAVEAGLMPRRGTVDRLLLTLTPEELRELKRILEEARSLPGA